MLIDQIDRFLRKDDERQQGVCLQVLRTPKFYPSGIDLWVEIPVDIIKKSAEEHEECMESIDDAKNRSQVKHIGIGKTSEWIDRIPSVTSAFNRVPPSISKGCEASPFLKERGCQEAIVMATRFQNPKKREQTKQVVVQENASSSMSTMTLAMNNTDRE